MARKVYKAPIDSGFSKDRIRSSKTRMTGSSKGRIHDKQEAPYPTINEPAVVHPWNNAIVKIRDNATIDVFSNTDNGIRINPNAKTIDMFTQSVKHHTTFIRSFVKRDEVHHVGATWTINATTARINTKGNTQIRADRNVSVEGRNVNVKASSRATVEGANVDVKARTRANIHASRIEIKAGSRADIEAPTVNVKAGSRANVEAPTVNVKASGRATVEGSNVDVKANSRATVEGRNVDVKTSGTLNVEAGGTMNMKAGGNMNFNASKYNFN